MPTDVAELFPTGAGFFYRTTSRGGGDIYHVPPDGAPRGPDRPTPLLASAACAQPF